MKNYVAPGINVDIAAPANVTSGDGLLVGGLFGVVAASALMGETIVLTVAGIFDLPKASTHVFAVGASVYWDQDLKQARSHGDEDSNSAGVSEALIGVCVQAAGAGASTVRVRLGQPVALA